MQALDTYYRTAVFRPGVRALIEPGRGTFEYRELRFDVEYSEAARSAVEQLCQDLEQGLEVRALGSRYAGFAAHAAELLQAFDRFGFLTEADPGRAEEAVSGAEFWLEVQAFAERARRRAGPVLFDAMAEARMSREGLVAYAREYYHLVRAGPGIIAAALPGATDAATRSLLEQFLASELGHDAMLADSLAAAGLDPVEVALELPLPETFALITALQVLAAQEPLAFKACAFLVEEENIEFHEVLAEASRRAGLDDAFVRPLLRHAGINEAGAHGSISRSLLAVVGAISAEERIVVLKHVASLVEALAALERALVDRYSLPEAAA